MTVTTLISPRRTGRRDVSEMFHLEDLNTALVHANQHAQLDRAASIPGGPGPDIPLGPPDLAQLQ
jgi:hypothetical protein